MDAQKKKTRIEVVASYLHKQWANGALKTLF